MRIDSATIGMESERTYTAVMQRSTQLSVTSGMASLTDGSGGLFQNLLNPDREESGLTGQGNPTNDLQNALNEMSAKQSLRAENLRSDERESTRRQLADIRQQCLDYLLFLLFGGRITERNDQIADAMEECCRSAQSAGISSESALAIRTTTYTFHRQYRFEESETTSFQTQGTVKCADGRELSFGLHLSMSRSFQEVYDETCFEKTISLCDPLVISLDGSIPSLSDQTFFFDIDGDGIEDEISTLSSGSGFLALDKNEDGAINDGTELFGTASGNGFADLASYDEDGNGFIDEGDAIFEKLKIWTQDEDGNTQLISLKDYGIGAIYTGSVPSDFSLTDDANNTRGIVRRSGFFLYEEGTAGSMQQMDLVKYDAAG